MTDITPPSDTEIERAVIGAMMIDETVIDKVVDIVTVDTFYKPCNQILFKVILDLNNTNTPVDPYTVCESLRKTGQLDNVGGEAFVYSILEAATTSANAEYHCHILKHKENLRKLLVLSRAIEANCLSAGAEVPTIREMILNAAYIISEGQKKKPYSDMMETMLVTSNRICELAEADGRLRGISTGYTMLDNMTDGLQNGDLIVLAGLPESGKTSLALNMAYNIARQNIAVGFFSLEMPVHRLGTRLASSEARQDISVSKRRKFQKENYKILADVCTKLSNYPLYLDDTAGLTHAKFYMKVKRMQREAGVKVVFVDHLQLMVGAPEYRSNRRLQIEDITRSMKRYAKDMDIPIVLLSHLSRLSEQQKRRPMLSDLRESGSIEEDADIVMILYKSEPEEIKKDMEELGRYYSNEEAEHVRELLIRKNRSGATGMIYLHWEPTLTQFSNLDY